jgi:hypothetical protein
MGFHSRAAAHMPKITMRNDKHRLEWCKALDHWTLEQWKRFTIWQSDGRIWVWRMQGERYLPKCANCKVWWRKNNGLVFHGSGPFSSSEGKS